MTRDGDYYFSITLPALIMATYGGGTALPLSANAWRSWIASAGQGLKLAEIAAGLVLAGELSWAPPPRWTRRPARTNGSMPTSGWGATAG